MISQKYLLLLVFVIFILLGVSNQNSLKTVQLKSEIDDLNSISRPQKIQNDKNRDPTTTQNNPAFPYYPGQYPFLPQPGGGCPFCEPNVFSYCYEKRIHDACCCFPHGNYYDQLKYPGYGYPGGIGYQCQYQDCRFLFANSCEEGILISECCCNLI
uniref:CSON004512 protein n=1 Tax=Culicoides sonorensis TaxID=179676 RepID=A0A336M5R6_CULSO